MGHRKGIKLVAYLPVAKTTVLDIGTQPDRGAAEFLNLSKLHFLLRQGYFDDAHNPFDVDFDVFGKGFKYDSLFPRLPQVPVEGRIQEVRVTVAGQLGLEVTRLGVDVEDMKFDPTDPNSLLMFPAIAKMLKGNDTIIGSPFDDPNLWGGKGNDLMWGRAGMDIVNGFKGNDVNDGGDGNDQLVDKKGDDTFQFSTPFILGSDNLNFNYDTILKFGKTDEIYLKYSLFPAAGMEVSKGELSFTEEAQDNNDFFLFFAGIFSYDADANGPNPATPIFGTLSDTKLKHWQIELGVSGDLY